MGKSTPPSFPEHSLVKVAGKGLIPMMLLRVGDKVEAYDVQRKIGTWSHVVSFKHRDTTREAPYLCLSYTFPHGGGVDELSSVTLAPQHSIFSVEKGAMVPASSILPGNHVLVSREGEMILAQITSATAMMCRGFYAPVTNCGTITVDGVVTSCFAGRPHWWNKQVKHRSKTDVPIPPGYRSPSYLVGVQKPQTLLPPDMLVAPEVTVVTTYPAAPVAVTEMVVPEMVVPEIVEEVVVADPGFAAMSYAEPAYTFAEPAYTLAEPAYTLAEPAFTTASTVVV